MHGIFFLYGTSRADSCIFFSFLSDSILFLLILLEYKSTHDCILIFFVNLMINTYI